MAVKTFVANEVLTASDTNTYLNNGGLVYVASTTFSGQPGISINNCFTSTYDNYRVLFRLWGSSGTFSTFRMRTGVTDDSGNNYYRTGFYTVYSGASVNAYNGGPLTNSLICQYGTSQSDAGSAIVEFYNPASATYKTVFFQDCLDPGSATRYTTNGVHTLTVAYDGFSVIPNSGNISGTVTVYGYRKV